MKSKHTRLVVAGLLVLGFCSFALGRYVRLSHIRAGSNAVVSTPATPPDYRQLPIEEIFTRPVTEFYDALRLAPEAARQKWWGQIEAMPKGPRRTAVLTEFFKLIAQFDANAAITLISSLRDRETQISALDAVVTVAPASAFPNLAEQILSLPKNVWRTDMQDFLAQVLSEWSELNPGAVADFMATHPTTNFGAYETELLGNWSANDPEGAIRWLNQQGTSRWPGGMAIVLPGWYQKDHEAALHYIVTHRNDDFVQSGLREILPQSYENSPEEAEAFIAALPDDDSKRLALAGAADIVGRGYHSDAVDDPKYSPTAVAEWMVQYPPRLWRGRLSKVLDDWPHEDQQGLVAWVESQPLQVRNEIAAEYPAPSPTDAQDAIIPVLALSDLDLRERLIRAMVTNARFSIEEISEKIRDSSLPADQKQYVLQIMSNAQKQQEARTGSTKVEEPLIIHSFQDGD